MAFVLPIVELLQSDDSTELAEGRPPRALVLAPTKEISKDHLSEHPAHVSSVDRFRLVKTIADEFEALATGLSTVSAYNAKKKVENQETAIAAGCDILVATPNRLREVLDESKVDVSQVKHIVLDEMDRMLEAAVLEDLKKILKHIFASGQ